MKLIRCLLGPEHLSTFVDSLVNLIPGITVWESRDFSADGQQTVSYRGVSYEIGSLSMAAEIVVDESWVDDIVRRVAEAHRLNQFTVRRLYVFSVEESYHIRNGFMDL